MKKRYLAMILILLMTFGVVYSLGKNSTNETVDNTPDPRDQQINELSDKVNELTKKEQEEKLRKAKLLALQNPEIIYNKLEEIGQLITYKSSVNYTDVIKENSFWGSKSITLDLNYNFGITYDLHAIQIDGFYDDVVVIKIPKDKLVLEYVELNGKSSKVQSTKSMLVKQFKPEDIEIIIEQSTDKTRELLESNKEIFDTAMLNLQTELKALAKRLNYSDAVVEII